MATVDVAVRWDGQDYLCMAVPDARLGVKFKCGKCSRGVVPPFMGEKCLLCGAEVSIVDDRRSGWAMNGFYGTATMRGESFWDEFNIPPNAERKPPDLKAIRARARDFFGLYHPTGGPCRCGSCNPVVHSDHPLHAAMSEVRRDHNTLLAEVERLNSKRWAYFSAPQYYPSGGMQDCVSRHASKEEAEGAMGKDLDGEVVDLFE